MPNYNLTGIDQATNYFDVFEAVSGWHGGLFPILFLFSIYFIILMVLKDYQFKESNTVASFIVTFVAIIFGALNLLGWVIIAIPIIFFIFSLFVLVFFRD